MTVLAAVSFAGRRAGCAPPHRSSDEWTAPGRCDHGTVGADDGAAAMTLGELGRLGVLLRAVRRRLRAVWALDTVQVLAPVVAVVALVLVAAGWVLPWAWTEWAALWLVVLLLVAVGVTAAVVRLPDMVVARAADRGLRHPRRLRHRPRDPRRRRALRPAHPRPCRSPGRRRRAAEAPCRCGGGVGRCWPRPSPSRPCSPSPSWPTRRTRVAPQRAREAAADRRRRPTSWRRRPTACAPTRPLRTPCAGSTS